MIENALKRLMLSVPSSSLPLPHLPFALFFPSTFYFAFLPHMFRPFMLTLASLER